MIRLTVRTAILLMFFCCESHSSEHFRKVSFASELMGEERIFNVRLPADYSHASQKRYPVVYQLQSDDTFLAAAAAIDNLTASGQMPQVILVGIEHRDKFSELSVDSPRSGNFYQHLIKEVKPFIEKQYPTENFSMLSGWSVGGGFVIHTMMQSAHFNGFFAYSPALSFEVNDTAYEARLQTLTANNGFLMLSIGNEQGEFLTTFEALTAKTAKYSPNIQSNTHGDFDHRGNAYVSQYYGFKALFSGWTPSDSLTHAGLKALQQHYQNLSEIYGFRVDIPKEILLFSAYSVMAGGTEQHLKKGAALVQFTLQHYPETKADFERMSGFFSSQKNTSSHGALQRILQPE